MTRSIRLALTALAALTLAALPAAAAIRQVGSSGCASATIQGAVDGGGGCQPAPLDHIFAGGDRNRRPDARGPLEEPLITSVV